jgi:hypothetical protein
MTQRGRDAGLKPRRYKETLAMFAGMWAADGGEGGAELAGDEGAESAEAGGELRGGEAVFAIKLTEKVGGGFIALLRIAFEAAGNEVAIGIAAGAELGDDVIEATGASPQAT